jgi:hypothetical protein
MPKEGFGLVDGKLKHLEMIQAIINRMASNSFVFKGWSVTILAGLSAFAAKDASKKFLVVAFFATMLFWMVDAYYLSLEREYRKLYEKVAKKEPKQIDFSMKLPPYSKVRAWFSSLTAPIMTGFYGLAGILIIGTIMWVKVSK